MMISSKGRYALRLMIDIGMNCDKGPVCIKEIAKRQDISAKYLEQIIWTLSQGSFVKSIRGPQGGYYLTKAPEEYTVGMILRQTEDCMVSVGCLEGKEKNCEWASHCASMRIWQELDEAVRTVLDKYTLKDLIDFERQCHG